MSTYQPKVHIRQGAEEFVLADGASMELGANVALSVDGTNVIITGLPTSDPSVAGALYSNAGVLTLSDG